MTKRQIKKLQKIIIEKRTGITQVKFAKSIGISQPTLSKVLNGSMGLNTGAYLNLCKKYNVDPFVLVK